MKISKRCFQESHLNPLYMLYKLPWNCLLLISQKLQRLGKRQAFYYLCFQANLDVNLWRVSFCVLQKVARPFKNKRQRQWVNIEPSWNHSFLPSTVKFSQGQVSYSRLKGRYTFGNYSKQIINLKTDLVRSIGELLIV